MIKKTIILGLVFLLLIVSTIAYDCSDSNGICIESSIIYKEKGCPFGDNNGICKCPKGYTSSKLSCGPAVIPKCCIPLENQDCKLNGYTCSDNCNTEQQKLNLNCDQGICCANTYQNIPKKFCGDGLCSGNESCITCKIDCTCKTNILESTLISNTEYIKKNQDLKIKLSNGPFEIKRGYLFLTGFNPEMMTGISSKKSFSLDKYQEKELILGKPKYNLKNQIPINLQTLTCYPIEQTYEIKGSKIIQNNFPLQLNSFNIKDSKISFSFEQTIDTTIINPEKIESCNNLEYKDMNEINDIAVIADNKLIKCQSFMKISNKKASLVCDLDNYNEIKIKFKTAIMSLVHEQKILYAKKNIGDSCKWNVECEPYECKSGICKPNCNGCINSNNDCVTFGTRTKTQFCDIDYSMKELKKEDSKCINNYECSTNLCIDNTCISQSFIQKIINWFKTFFK